MNKINESLSNSHLSLNAVVCALDPLIYNESLKDDFNLGYSIACLSNIKYALVESAVLIYDKLPEHQKQSYLEQLFKYDILTKGDIESYNKSRVL